MNRVSCLLLLALATVGATAHAAGADSLTALSVDNCGGAWASIFRQSHEAKKGVTLFVSGEKIGGLVLGCNLQDKTVELKSQEYGRIVVAIDRIDAAAMP